MEEELKDENIVEDETPIFTWMVLLEKYFDCDSEYEKDE